MTRLYASLALAIVAGCSKSSDPVAKQSPQEPSGSAAAAAAKPATATDEELVTFCTKSYFKMMDCFKDEEFWKVFSTMYFANTKLTSDDTEREHWVGIMKEDLLKLYNEHGFEQNCQVTVEKNKAPSAKSVKAVNEAAAKSCAAFGSAFGYMVFNEGAFHQPKQ